VTAISCVNPGLISEHDHFVVNPIGRLHLRTDELFELTAAERPAEIAVTFAGRDLSYGALRTDVLALAARLQNLGVRPGTLVGICMDRCAEMVTALMATFKAGAAYLPLDPGFPPDRIAFMQEDARPLVVITQSHLVEKLPFTAAHVLCLDANPRGAESNGPREFSQPVGASIDGIAYVLYTSGSTGKPKGVQITHRSLTNMLLAIAGDIALTSADVVLATTTISFDISTFELFAPLITGSRLVVAPRAVAMDGKLLADAVKKESVTVLQATPAGWGVLLESGWSGAPGLKMLTAGEPLTRTLAGRLLERGAGLWNLYGPTETTVYSSGKRIFPGTKITVGPPLPNCTAYVLDENQQRLPVGAIGELYIGGVCVGAGYLNRPELNAEKFRLDPFSDAPGARLYRSGDLARLLPNGEIDVLGRADNQIKLRGYRIELEEVEAVLDSHPSIRKAVAKVVTLEGHDPALVAYVVLNDPGNSQQEEWRQHALRSLPWYMVPTFFQEVDSFLLTPNGKVDRKVLPAFTLPKVAPETAERQNGLEQVVLGYWRKYLQRPDIGLDHDFFLSGGHSLPAVRMLTAIETELKLKVSISHLLEAPTARKFSRLLIETKDSGARCIIAMQPEGSRPPIYLIHHMLGDLFIYHAMARLMAPDRPAYGIQPLDDLALTCQNCSIKNLATTYVKEIANRHTTGPIHLAGFSTGSTIAFEMARQFKELGFHVGLLALIDGVIDMEPPPMSPLRKRWRMARWKLRKISLKFNDEIAEGPRQFVMKRLRHLWLHHRLESLEKSATPNEATAEQTLFLAERAYKPEPFPGAALLVRFRDEAWDYGPDPLMGWSSLIQGGIEVVDLEGGHMSGMRPEGAPAMVAMLKLAMEKCEAASALRKAV
jgi:surfactin family lipopeptide synthetase A